MILLVERFFTSTFLALFILSVLVGVLVFIFMGYTSRFIS